MSLVRTYQNVILTQISSFSAQNASPNVFQPQPSSLLSTKIRRRLRTQTTKKMVRQLQQFCRLSKQNHRFFSSYKYSLSFTYQKTLFLDVVSPLYQKNERMIYQTSWISLYIYYLMTSVMNKHLKCLLVSLISIASLTTLQFHYSMLCNVMNNIVNFWRWLDSNRGPLELEATALPTEPHYCPQKSPVSSAFYVML